MAETITVEWAPFVKAAGVDIAKLIAAADKVNTEFLSKQKGFLRRELVKKNENEFADILHRQSLADAKSASEKISDCAAAGAYFKLMDGEKSAVAGAGFSYFQIVKKWAP